MGTSERLERERQQKRARILDAARELFVERGVEAVTLREIAQKIEYSTTAIYVQFADKAALVDAMLREDFSHFAQGLEAAVSIEDPVERFIALGESYMDFAMRMPHHYQLLFLTPPKGANHKAELTSPAGIEGYRVLLATIEECIQTKRFRPELTDADGLAQFVWGSVHGIVSLLIVHGGHPAFRWRPKSALAKHHTDVMLHGLLRDPADIKRSLTPRAKRSRK